MNRAIRFQAWDKERKVMHPPRSLEDYIHYSNSELEIVDIDCIFLQFTGLSDKNGIEVYCGDVLKIKLNPESIKNFAVKIITDQWCASNQSSCHGLAGVLHESEVIGNIHQHPELLK